MQQLLPANIALTAKTSPVTVIPQHPFIHYADFYWTNSPQLPILTRMERREAIRRLKTLEPILRAEGAAAAYLFGSTARDQATDTSDIDLLVEIRPNKRLSLMDIARLTRLSSEAIKANVDLIPNHAMKPHILDRIKPSLKRIF
jgi:predicted nucleotidyltransferase